MDSVNFQKPQASNALQQDKIPIIGRAKSEYSLKKILHKHAKSS